MVPVLSVAWSMADVTWSVDRLAESWVESWAKTRAEWQSQEMESGVTAGVSKSLVQNKPLICNV